MEIWEDESDFKVSLGALWQYHKKLHELTGLVHSHHQPDTALNIWHTVSHLSLQMMFWEDTHFTDEETKAERRKVASKGTQVVSGRTRI